MQKRLLVFILTVVIALSCIAMAAGSDSIRILEVYGVVTAEGEVSFEPAYAMVVPGDYLDESEGDYSFHAMAKDGSELAVVAFELNTYEWAEESGMGFFGFSVLFPKDTDHFVMNDSAGEVMAVLSVPAQMPEASFDEITFDTAEPFTLSWTWSSPEDLELFAELYYICDEYSEWIDFDITDNTYEIDFAEMDLPESEQAMFLLVVTDGVNTVEVYSNSFAVPGEVALETAHVFAVVAPEEQEEDTLPPVEKNEPKNVATDEETIVLTIASKVVTKGGIVLAEPQVAPQIVNGRTMLPFRYLVQTVLGGDVEYFAETRTIQATVNEHEIIMVVDLPQIIIDGAEYDYGQAPVIVDNFTLVPLRAFEKVITDLKWDAATQQVTIFP